MTLIATITGTLDAGSVTGLAPSATTDTTNSSNINFTQAGTGAVTRTVSSKLRDIVNAADFGVKGDGGTYTTQMQAALDAIKAAGGGRLMLPAGAFSCGAVTYATPSGSSFVQGIRLRDKAEKRQSLPSLDRIAFCSRRTAQRHFSQVSSSRSSRLWPQV
jgi:hypothetical protein